MMMLQAKSADVDDLHARRISAVENLLRQDLSTIESIEDTIEIIDVEMGKDPEYLTVGKIPLERVHKLLSKLDSIRRSKERGPVVLESDNDLSHKFMGQVESIFKNLPKPLEWQSFLMNDLNILTDIPLKVQKAKFFVPHFENTGCTDFYHQTAGYVIPWSFHCRNHMKCFLKSGQGLPGELQSLQLKKELLTQLLIIV